MKTQILRPSDLTVQGDVERELKWNPEVNAAHIGVAADHGILTLAGQVDTYAERIAAVKAAQRVRGVAVVADELTVEVVGNHPTDADIASLISAAFTASGTIPSNRIQVVVHDRIVVLTGEVDWNFQREAAHDVIESVTGVKFVDSRITLTTRPSASDTVERIEHAMIRQATLDADDITVNVAGTEVTLSGDVGTWEERTTAGRAAWSSPHVTEVHNDLIIHAPAV